jgi:hypothetical protein
MKEVNFLQKIVIISLIMIIATALAIPIFADEINDALNDTSNSTNNSSLNNSGNNSLTSDNSTLNNTNNSTFTSEQLQTLTETQSKLTVLIATIESLKLTYGATKAKGLLNALDQFEKQANRLNAEISLFMQNPLINSTESIDRRINSFVKREAALEYKVSIKQALLIKMDEKAVKLKTQKKQKTNKGQNK